MSDIHEDRIAWDEDERKQCRREWEQRICLAIDEQVDEGERADKADAQYEAGLAAVRELRKLRRKVDGL